MATPAEATAALTGMIPLVATTGLMRGAAQIGKPRRGTVTRRRKTRSTKQAKLRDKKLTQAELKELADELAARMKKVKAKQKEPTKTTKAVKAKSPFNSGKKITAKRVKISKPKRKKRSRIVGG